MQFTHGENGRTRFRVPFFRYSVDRCEKNEFSEPYPFLFPRMSDCQSRIPTDQPQCLRPRPPPPWPPTLREGAAPRAASSRRPRDPPTTAAATTPLKNSPRHRPKSFFFVSHPQHACPLVLAPGDDDDDDRCRTPNPAPSLTLLTCKILVWKTSFEWLGSLTHTRVGLPSVCRPNRGVR